MTRIEEVYVITERHSGRFVTVVGDMKQANRTVLFLNQMKPKRDEELLYEYKKWHVRFDT